MNTKNNKRRRDSIERIENTFIEFLQTKEFHEITISDICKAAGINRSTFYANFLDVYDLSEKIIDKLHNDVFVLYKDEFLDGKSISDYLKLFNHIKENQSLYKIYFKLEKDRSNHHWFYYNECLAKDYFNNEHIDYHVEFFRNGFNSILKMWLFNGCKESCEELQKILETEYEGRYLFMKKYFSSNNDK